MTRNVRISFHFREIPVFRTVRDEISVSPRTEMNDESVVKNHHQFFIAATGFPDVDEFRTTFHFHSSRNKKIFRNSNNVTDENIEFSRNETNENRSRNRSGIQEISRTQARDRRTGAGTSEDENELDSTRSVQTRDERGNLENQVENHRRKRQEIETGENVAEFRFKIIVEYRNERDQTPTALIKKDGARGARGVAKRTRANRAKKHFLKIGE